MAERRSQLTRRALVAMVAALALGVAVVPAAGLATVQSQSPVQATVTAIDPGSLVGRGLAVDVTVEYQCESALDPLSLYVTLRQRFLGRVAVGSGYVDGADLGRCLGFVPQHTVVRVYAWDVPFRLGRALASSELWLYGGDEYVLVTDDATIGLRYR